ncbi:Outer membrane protein assembly factor BamD [Sulfidibacter corallicola]|uniref:Outer membrane protein assembly factor BamD n=1 Tax=Sulfidibacter corallicola TaxID=2818388 RepID=A0A8A4TQF4_SULCO|nr:outer membrane protein assembly factor BamD [Sulfidibacter corallicola]QTD52216.1 outer membrane protein assembly factor BamD [Sulfidibacter corallicola]
MSESRIDSAVSLEAARPLRWFVPALLILAVLLSTACSGPKKKEKLANRLVRGDVTTDELFNRATTLFQKRKFVDARRWLRVIEAHAPDSSVFPDVKLAIADSYFFDKMATYIEASVEYKSFLTHFPTHKKADYAQYQYAMCFFTEIENADRDQTSTFTAYTEFKNLIDRHPNSPYAGKAKEKIDLCLLRLAEHEFTVGYYYFRRGRGFEKSAESRLKGIINNYEGQYDPEKTYFFLAETLWRREKFKEAIFYYQNLARNYAESEYMPFVQDKLARWERIKEEGQDPGEITAEVPSDPLNTF